MKTTMKSLHGESDEEPLSLDMSFDEALEMLLNTPPPVETDDELHREERKDEDCD